MNETLGWYILLFNWWVCHLNVGGIQFPFFIKYSIDIKHLETARFNGRKINDDATSNIYSKHHIIIF